MPAPAGFEEGLVRWLLEPAGGPPEPKTPDELGALVAHLYGIGAPLPVIAAGLALELEDLKDGGRPLDEVFAEMLRRRNDLETLSRNAARGKLWTVARVCQKAFEASLVMSGSPLPRIQWLNEQAQWRRAAAPDADAGRELKEIRVTFIDERQAGAEEEQADARPEGAAVGKAAAGAREV